MADEHRQLNPGLLNFGSFAMDWTRVYAVVAHRPTPHDPIELAIFADLPGTQPGQPAAKTDLANGDANHWNLAKSDPRFTWVERDKSALALDMTKVTAIVVPGSGRKASISFALADGEGASVSVDGDVAYSLLAKIPRPNMPK